MYMYHTNNTNKFLGFVLLIDVKTSTRARHARSAEQVAVVAINIAKNSRFVNIKMITTISYISNNVYFDFALFSLPNFIKSAKYHPGRLYLKKHSVPEMDNNNVTLFLSSTIYFLSHLILYYYIILLHLNKTKTNKIFYIFLFISEQSFHKYI